MLYFWAVLGILVIPATFCLAFSGFWAGFGVLFWGFQHFQLLFPALFWILGWVWGAVLEISAVSATFFSSFPDFWWGLGCCFVDFYGFSYFFLLFSGFLAGFGVLFWEFLRFQLLFPAFFRLFGRVWGAVLGIFAVSAPQSPLAMLSTYGYCTLW